MKPILVERPLAPQDVGPNRKNARSVTVNIAESPLAWLSARGLVDGRQMAAGEMLRHDYERAGLPQRMTMEWDAPPQARTARGSPSPVHATIAQIDAKRRFGEALAHAGSGLSDILWRVVCAGEALPFAEKALGWPTRSGRIILLLALDRVADYYRIN